MKFLTVLGLLWGSAAFAAPTTVSVGEAALLFTLPAINEDAALAAVGSARVSLADFTGVAPSHASKAVLLYFFDRDRQGAGLGSLERLHKRWSGKGLQVIAITVDSTDLGTLSTEIEDQKLSFPVLRDNHRVVSTRYGAGELPVALVVDADGRVFAIGNPTGESFEGELEGEVSALLGR